MPKLTARLAAFVAISGLFTCGPALATPNVVASIKPLHSLVAQVMHGVGAPGLLVSGNASAHTYTLRPSDATMLEAADIVFWTGEGLELFLEDALATLAGEALVVAMRDAPGIEMLPMREGGVFAADEGGDAQGAHDHDKHDHGPSDMHFWLDPDNAVHMVETIAETLSTADLENAATYVANAASTIAELEALAAVIDERLEPIREDHFIVFHDAFQYFEARFGLGLAGSITVSPEIAPGAQRIEELRRFVGELGAICVFAEPQFEPAIVNTIIEGTAARAGVLDPEGGELPEGRDHYAALLNELADNLLDCLGE